MATPAQSLTDTVLDDAYRIVRLIGEGGMGMVYEGIHLRLNKKVAVKVMARDLAANSEALARFRREAQITSGLGHPHIVQVFDFGATTGGEPYLVMEFLEGEDLEHRLRRVGRRPPTEALRIVRQVVSALAATHAKGIVHRDLKPANIFLLDAAGEADFVKVVDFGISKVRASTTRLTQSSAVMGTPNYMSPEQALGQVDDIDERTDQWALACIAWELLSGRGPFVGDSVHSLLFQVVHEAPRALPAAASWLPAKAEEVLRCALSKRRDERFSSVTDFYLALEAAFDGESPSRKDAAVASRSQTSNKGNFPSRTVSRIRALPTTLTRTVGEVEQSTPPSHPSRKALGTGAAVVTTAVVAGAFLFFRPSTNGSHEAAARLPPPSISKPPPMPAPPSPPATSSFAPTPAPIEVAAPAVQPPTLADDARTKSRKAEPNGKRQPTKPATMPIPKAAEPDSDLAPPVPHRPKVQRNLIKEL